MASPSVIIYLVSLVAGPPAISPRPPYQIRPPYTFGQLTGEFREEPHVPEALRTASASGTAVMRRHVFSDGFSGPEPDQFLKSPLTVLGYIK